MTTDAAGVEFDAELLGVVKRFGAITAVDGVDLAVRSGEFLSLLGPSGCGKTTALRLLAGFEQPDEGSIRIGGVDAIGIPPYRRSVNTVFQHYALFPHMSVLENVAYGLKQRNVAGGERKRLAEEALELVQLRGFAAPAAARALRRAAAARRPGARAGSAAPRPAARRAARGARPQAAPRDADRAQAHADAARAHVRLRDARPGGGDVDERSHRRDVRRAHRATRPAAGHLRPSRERLRGRVHRRHELPGGDDRRRRRSGLVGNGRAAARARARRGTARRSGPHRGAARERRDRTRVRAGGGGQPRRGRRSSPP